jgi:hypothetical protein
VVKEYRALLEEAKGEPGFGTLEGFIAAKVIGRGLEARRQEPHARELHQGDGIDDALDVGGFKVSFGPRTTTRRSSST